MLWVGGGVGVQGKPIANHRFLGSPRFETTSNSPVDLGGVHYWTECPIKSDKLIDPGSTLRLLGSEGNLPRTTPLFMSAGLKGDGFGRTPAARFWPKVSCASLKTAERLFFEGTPPWSGFKGTPKGEAQVLGSPSEKASHPQGHGCWETFYMFARCGLVEIQPLNC